MNMRGYAAAVATSAVISSGPALAWDATVEGPDVFGTTKVLAIEVGSTGSFVVQCDSKDKLLVALIFPKKEFEEIGERPADLYVQAVSEQPLKIAAVFRTWNDNYAGVAAGGRDEVTMAIIHEIAAAKGRINVGAEISGNQTSASFASRGSTKAMQKVVEHCRLSDIGLPPA